MTIANQLPWRNPNKMYTSINYKIISQSAGKKINRRLRCICFTRLCLSIIVIIFALLTNIIYKKNYQIHTSFDYLCIFKLLKQTIFLIVAYQWNRWDYNLYRCFSVCMLVRSFCPKFDFYTILFTILSFKNLIWNYRWSFEGCFDWSTDYKEFKFLKNLWFVFIMSSSEK